MAAGRSDRMFWLDGGGATPWSGTRSVIGTLDEDDVSLTFHAGRREVRRHGAGPSEVVGDDVFTALEEHLDADRASGEDVSWVGYLGYACRTDLPGRPSDDPAVPDAVWMRCRSPRVLEGHPTRAHPAAPTSADEPVPEWYAAAFAEVQRQLHLGNSYEVNLTCRESAVSARDPVATYLRLRETDPAPYSGYLQHRGVHLLSSSPERFATVNRQRVVEARPIKGTTPRGADETDDARLREHLASDPKFRAENLMIVDLLRNDVGMVSAPGTVAVPELMQVESYRSVHQLVSTVQGRLRDEVSTVQALRAIFPAGSMTGAPKLRTMEVIDAVEQTPRGVYAGAFGWLAPDGRADLAVVIRSLVARPEGDRWRYAWGTGGGITVQSDVREEWEETRWKAARIRAALQGPARPQGGDAA
ncbi:anthranilate synthase component I family protein [Nocardioides marmoribigeumensis]|uniref:Para-aminobenzoate synthetase n=1 Tax=Nocardioides marmoribigeumensis TaxID=433649 RepID=A0ABU2BVT8_9ACTN|nr:chorismate-binding protein [Nocardioides marmoribigeumensis]MDR7362754.1 para-aminobenzoate synthetase [Nocardioides marmoribigeumensis]